MVWLFSHLQSTPLLAVTSPPPHLLYFTPQQSLVMVCLKDTPKIACSFFFKIFGGPSLTVSLLWQGDYVVNQKFLRTGQDSNLRWDCSARLTVWTVRPTTATRTFVGRVGFEPTAFLMYWIYSPAPFHHQSSLPIHP